MKALRGLLAAALLGSGAALAAEQSLLGKINDACSPGAGKAADAGCKGAPRYVFVARGRTYLITNQDYPGLSGRAGQMAKVTGDVLGDEITIKSIAESSKARK